MVRDNSKSQKPLPPLSSEQVYQFLAQKKWSELVELLHAYCKIIPSDYALEAAFKVVESELIRNFDEFQQDEKFERNLSNLYLLHSGKLYLLSDTTVNKLIVELAKVHDKKATLSRQIIMPLNFLKIVFALVLLKNFHKLCLKLSRTHKVKESV